MFIQDILNTSRIITVEPHENLSRALSKLSTSHDAAFLFDDEKKLLGIINPYYCLIKSSYPSNAKVEHCVYHAPRVHIDYPPAKIADLFIQSKVHYLPVFDQSDTFIGIISARDLLREIQSMPIFHAPIVEALKIKKNPPATIDENDSIATAINMFKLTKFSKLIVTNGHNRLKGLLSYYDLISYLVTPKISQGRGEHHEGAKVLFHHQKVKDFAKSYVLTLTSDHTLKEVIQLILEKKIGSVVIVNNKRVPVGIITTKDLLRFFMQKGQGKQIEVVSKNLSKRNRQVFGGFFSHFSKIVTKTPNVEKAKVFIKEEKQGNLFEIVLSLFPKKGKPEVIRREERNIFNILLPLQNALKRISNK